MTRWSAIRMKAMCSTAATGRTSSAIRRMVHPILVAVEAAAAAMARIMAMAAVAADIGTGDGRSPGRGIVLPCLTVGCQLASDRFLFGRREKVAVEMSRRRRLAGSGTALM